MPNVTPHPNSDKHLQTRRRLTPAEKRSILLYNATLRNISIYRTPQKYRVRCLNPSLYRKGSHMVERCLGIYWHPKDRRIQNRRRGKMFIIIKRSLNNFKEMLSVNPYHTFEWWIRGRQWPLFIRDRVYRKFDVYTSNQSVYTSNSWMGNIRVPRGWCNSSSVYLKSFTESLLCPITVIPTFFFTLARIIPSCHGIDFLYSMIVPELFCGGARRSEKTFGWLLAPDRSAFQMSRETMFVLEVSTFHQIQK